MDIEKIRIYCLSKPAVEETFPFGPDLLVYKVAGKMFLLCSLNEVSLRFNIKCDPELAVELRERYHAVTPAYHMNKKHWNTVYADGSVPDRQQMEWIDHSYELVVQSLPLKMRSMINNPPAKK